MSTFAILSIGRELMLGHTVDTNAAFLLSQMSSLGHAPLECRIVTDDLADIQNAISQLTKHSEILLITGGLGPTPDDLTRDGIAKAAGKELIFSEELLEQIANRFKRFNRPMTESNRSQAYLPEGAKSITNNYGTAPGIHCAIDGCDIFAMPGVPSEMKEMFTKGVLPAIPTSDKKLHVKHLKLCGIGESRIGEILFDLEKKYPTIEIGTSVDNMIITVRFSGLNLDDITDAASEADEIFADNVFSENGDSLETVIIKKLLTEKKTLSLAESCTGGMIAANLIGISGASEAIIEGVVSYSNEAKVARLNVSKETINKHGAVSRECAIEMAKGSREISGADYALSVTGIAGPTGGTEDKPVGTVYIALASKEDVLSVRYNFIFNRQGNRIASTRAAIDTLRRKLFDLEYHQGTTITKNL